MKAHKITLDIAKEHYNEFRIKFKNSKNKASESLINVYKNWHPEHYNVLYNDFIKKENKQKENKHSRRRCI